MKEVGADVTTEQLKEFVWKTLKSGKVGYSFLVTRSLICIGRQDALPSPTPQFKMICSVLA